MSINAAIDRDGTGATGHGTRMDRMYRVQRHVYDATRAYYLLGRDQLISTLQPPPGGHVLEIGCGTGRNLAKAARLYPDATFTGIDISEEMLKTALHTVSRDNLHSRIALYQADATTLGEHPIIGRRKYDRVFFSYTLSMIPDWELALAQAVSLRADAGHVMVVDFGTGRSLPRPLVVALRKWLDVFDVVPRDTLLAVADRLAAQQGLTNVSRPSHRGYAIHTVIGPNRHENVI